MRSISAEGLAKLATTHSVEPVVIVEIDWVDGDTRSYADRTVGSIPGRILEVSGLDSIRNLAGTGDSQAVTVTISDADGSIKALLDAYDVHLRPARLYQYFMGLDLSDKFLLLGGRVNSPVTWDGVKRSFTFTICSRLESEEVGFSAESADFSYMPSELVGQSWPIVFGTVQDLPAVRISSSGGGSGAITPPSQPTTYTRTGVGILSGMELWEQLPDRADDSDYILSLLVKLEEKVHLETVRDKWLREESATATQQVAELESRIDTIVHQVNTSAADRQRQIACAAARRADQIAEAKSKGLGPNPIKTTGGEDFPTGTIGIEINGGIFTGYFSGSDFYVLDRKHEANDEAAEERYIQKTTDHPSCIDATVREQYYSFSSIVPKGQGGQYPGTANNIYISSGRVYLTTEPGTRVDQGTTPIVQQFWADAGTPITIRGRDNEEVEDEDEPVQYVAAAVEGTILAVKAYKQFGSERRLTIVPSAYYSTRLVTYGPLNATYISMPRQLSNISDRWSDDLYVTLRSSVGPHPCDVLTHIIEEYTDLAYDTTSFDAIYESLTCMPINCALTGSPDALSLLQDLAFQLRCALWIKDDTFYIRYLPEQPTAVDTITLSDVDSESGISVNLTPTEELVTKLTATWQITKMPTVQTARVNQEQRIVLRHNINKYGTHAQSYDFFAFTQPEVVNKCATFWLIRKANTWKEVRFRTYLTKLNLETLDAVYLDFGSTYLTADPVLAIVKSAVYDSANNTIEFVCETSIKAGSAEPYRFFWPSHLPLTDTWPTPDEIAAGCAGRGAMATEVVGALPFGDTSLLQLSGAIFVGGPNVAFGSHSDYGDPTPTDVGFAPKETYVEPVNVDFSDADSVPALDLEDYQRPKTAPLASGYSTGGGSSSDAIDLNTTPVRDASGNSGYLADVLQFSSDGALCLRSDALIDSDADGAHVFDFKYDSETQKYGAGTAFLQDEEA